MTGNAAPDVKGGSHTQPISRADGRIQTSGVQGHSRGEIALQSWRTTPEKGLLGSLLGPEGV
jgi:hypothetical protein